MSYQFQTNRDRVSESSIYGSSLIMDDVLESLGTLKAKFSRLNEEIRS
jgi:hypothetical protein